MTVLTQQPMDRVVLSDVTWDLDWDLEGAGSTAFGD